MKVKFRSFSILILVFTFSLGAYAQVLPDTTVYEVDRDFDVVKRNMDSVDVNRYLEQNDFYYYLSTGQKETIWQKFKRWIFEHFIRPLFEGDTGKVTNTVIYIIAIAGACLLFYFIFKSRRKSEIARKDLSWGQVFSNPADVEFKQFYEWMEAAENKDDYNEAIKFLYLLTIKNLDEKNIVRYRSNLTNSQVLRMLTDDEVKRIFLEISRNFEYVWFGHFTLSKEDYEIIRDSAFKSKLFE